MIDPATTALLLVEYQNDFMSPGGTLHDTVGPVIEETGMREHSQEMLAAAREHGILIVHAPISFQEGHPEISPSGFGVLQAVKETASFEAMSWGAQIVDEMAPADSEIVLEGKRGLDAFAATTLDFMLRSSSIDTVACAGFLTNACIESTCRSAYDAGYNVITLTDCMAATSIEAHTNAIATNFPTFSHPMSYRDFIQEVAAGSPQAA